METNPPDAQPVHFRAETRQLLNILIHSLYTEREVFLRELISNASDALTRLQFESLTNHEMLDPGAELGIWIRIDPDQKTIVLQDTGIGMNAAECVENLGTIAHSGARAFLEAAKEGSPQLAHIIGQFGVGFYSVFMVAKKIEVKSRSYRPGDQGVLWASFGEDTFTVEETEKTTRGTVVTIYLKDDALEFNDENRIRQIVKTHSDYIPYPIYVGESAEPVNRQISLWRQPPQQVNEEEYKEFYRQFTLDFREPLAKIHLSIDAPVQLFALLFIPLSSERTFLALRKEDGLKLYARKILIQEYCKDLLPPYLRFVDGVIDSEDLPLSISRESIQSNRILTQLKRLLTNKIIDMLRNLGKEKPEEYARFWSAHGRAIKEGIATDAEQLQALQSLLRFHSLNHPDRWISLEEYSLEMPSAQNQIYYLLGEDEHSLAHSPHLEIFRKYGFDVLLLADPLDPFVLMRLSSYAGHELKNAAEDKLVLPGEPEQAHQESPTNDILEQNENMIARFKQILGERVSDVRVTRRLVDSPARLVQAEGELRPELQKVYRLLNQEYTPPKKVLEINPAHPILIGLNQHPSDSPLSRLTVELVFENASLFEGSLPDPAGLASKVQQLLGLALGSSHQEENEQTRGLDHAPDSS